MDEQLNRLVWKLMPFNGQQATGTSRDLVQSGLPRKDAGLFGLYSAMCGRSNLFANSDAGHRPELVLVGSSEDQTQATHMAYDPETHKVLCVPDCTVDADLALRLRDLGLLEMVVLG